MSVFPNPYTDQDVEFVANALFDVNRTIEPGTRGAYQKRAREVLDALAAAGWLSPTSINRVRRQVAGDIRAWARGEIRSWPPPNTITGAIEMAARVAELTTPNISDQGES